MRERKGTYTEHAIQPVPHSDRVCGPPKVQYDPTHDLRDGLDVAVSCLRPQVVQKLTHEQRTIPSLECDFAIVYERDAGIRVRFSRLDFGLQP
jgi:hypothetical protein